MMAAIGLSSCTFTTNDAIMATQDAAISMDQTAHPGHFPFLMM